VDIKLVRREHDAAQCAADVSTRDAKRCRCDPTHGQSAGHDKSREQTHNKAEKNEEQTVGRLAKRQGPRQTAYGASVTISGSHSGMFG
jgi:hypothetical protein